MMTRTVKINIAPKSLLPRDKDGNENKKTSLRSSSARMVLCERSSFRGDGCDTNRTRERFEGFDFERRSRGTSAKMFASKSNSSSSSNYDNSNTNDSLSDIMKKYVAKDATKALGSAIGSVQKMTTKKKREEYNGVFALLFLNFLFFACDHWLLIPQMKMLYLNHASPLWWQFVTCTFCHASWDHLSSNIFFLYIFGKLIEEEEGAFGVWCSYLATGVGASVVSWIVLPKSAGGILGVGTSSTISLGASGAVFGLFAVSVLVKLKFEWKRILEVVVLGQFVLQRILHETSMIGKSVGGVGLGGVNHIAHLAGALAGVVLIALLSKILPE